MNFPYQILIEQLEKALIAGINPTPDCYPYIPYSLTSFLPLLRAGIDFYHVFRKGGSPTFLDVGCGIGSKVVLAQNMRCNAFGLEINPEYVAIARKIHHRSKILKGDARTFDKYSDFNIIYSYVPMTESKDHQMIRDRIIEDAAEGTILLLRGFFPQLNDKRICPISFGKGHYPENFQIKLTTPTPAMLHLTDIQKSA